MKKLAFVLRIAPNGIDKVPEALERNQIIIGWAYAEGLLDEKLSWEKFREIIQKQYYYDEPTLRRAGSAAGNMWRFIREMKEHDYVIVPHINGFYVAEITGPAIYDKSKIEEDTTYRRPVKWLNDKKIIPRDVARSALISRMKNQGTCVYATDLISEIEECLIASKSTTRPSFQSDLQSRLVMETLREIRSGRIESYKFEQLIQSVLENLGADEVKIIPRNQDKGADLLATFIVAGAFKQVIAVQAKHWQPEPPVGKEVVDQLIKGIEAESADLGMVITSGNISPDASLAAEQYYEEKGIRIELIDGEQFSKLIVEHGIKKK